MLLILKHVQTTAVTNLTYQTIGKSRKAPGMYRYTV